MCAAVGKLPIEGANGISRTRSRYCALCALLDPLAVAIVNVAVPAGGDQTVLCIVDVVGVAVLDHISSRIVLVARVELVGGIGRAAQRFVGGLSGYPRAVR